LTGLEINARRGQDEDAPPRREPAWRLWPPRINGNAVSLPAPVRGRAAGLTPRALWTNHRLFTVAVALSVVPRVIAALGFRPALLIEDSFGYLQDGVHLAPGQLRPSGYPVLLRVLKPFHSLLLVTTLQHLMGIGIAIVIYALLRSRGLPAWGASLAAAPTLFDSRQVWLEASILPDVLFTFVTVVAIALLLTRRTPTTWQAAVAGLLVSWSAVIRGNGFPVIVVILASLLARRVGWRAITACTAAFALPVLGYMLVFYADYGQFNITNSDGLFLWSRTMSFANCAVIKPPPDLVPLCPDKQPDAQLAPAPAWSLSSMLTERSPADYLWQQGSWYQHDAHPGVTAYNNSLGTRFALDAIRAQPLGYLKVVARDVMLTFAATDRPETFLSLHFITTPHVATLSHREMAFLGSYAHTTSNTTAVQPWAFFMLEYQLPVYFPGVVFFLVLVAGLAGVIRSWRRWGGAAALPWAAAAINIVVPVALHEYDYRYAISAVPLACLAAGLAFARKAASPEGAPAAPAAIPADPALIQDKADNEPD